jgi:hypothetical protein
MGAGLASSEDFLTIGHMGHKSMTIVYAQVFCYYMLYFTGWFVNIKIKFKKRFF